MFIDTLPSPYYDRVVGNVASNFADLVVVGKRIELGIRRGKEEERRSQCRNVRAHLPTREISCSFVPDSICQSASYAIFPSLPTVSRHRDH
ncbi:hypothetical protein CR513_51359, partial [Mucuna pruriens]